MLSRLKAVTGALLSTETVVGESVVVIKKLLQMQV